MVRESKSMRACYCVGEESAVISDDAGGCLQDLFAASLRRHFNGPCGTLHLRGLNRPLDLCLGRRLNADGGKPCKQEGKPEI